MKKLINSKAELKKKNVAYKKTCSPYGTVLDLKFFPDLLAL